MRLLYTFFYSALMPFILLRLYWRGRALPSYRERWTERLGRVHYQSKHPTLWVHAVSVGEVIAAVPLVKALEQSYPKHAIVMTTMTPTGAERVQAAFGDRVKHVYLPYDLPLFMNRFLSAIKPSIALIIETELWPNLLHCCRRRGIPSVLVNARLSEKSAKGYAKASLLTRPMLTKLDHILAQNENTAARFLALGMPSSKMTVTGSIKYDLDIPQAMIVKAKNMRKTWQNASKVLVAASTHPEEEEKLLAACTKLFAKEKRFKLILVPRHPERFDEVYQLVCSKKLGRAVRKSTWNQSDDWQILVGDTMGEMFFYFGLADCVFMGGTLVGRGGHNFIEPAALALPIISGKHYFNFKEIGDELAHRKALAVCQTEEEVTTALEKLLIEEEQFVDGRAGKAFVDSNTGALEKSLNFIKKYTLDG